MTMKSLPHQLNNRKFTKAVVFVHGLDGSAKSWMGDPNRLVDRLSREREIYNHIGLFAFEYDPKMAEPGPLSKLFSKTRSNPDTKKISMQLKSSLLELLAGYKTIVFVGHGMGVWVIKNALNNDDTHCSVLEIDDPASDLAYDKVLALLHQLLEVGKQTGHN
jgi:hypothetical protein